MARTAGTAVRAVSLWAAGLIVLAACDDGARPRALPLAAHRAYSGAPPTVPHPIVERSRQECLSCHLRGDATGDDGQTLAKATPHPELEHCVGCHVSTQGRGVFRPTRFRGKTYPLGLRSQPAGPWAIPHPLTLRENCLGCHDTARTHPLLRVSHPERERCVQCHLPAFEGAPGPRPDRPAEPVAGVVASWSL